MFMIYTAWAYIGKTVEGKVFTRKKRTYMWTGGGVCYAILKTSIQRKDHGMNVLMGGIAKGQIVKVLHTRMGIFTAEARDTFSTTDTCYPLTIIRPLKSQGWEHLRELSCERDMIKWIVGVK